EPRGVVPGEERFGKASDLVEAPTAHEHGRGRNEIAPHEVTGDPAASWRGDLKAGDARARRPLFEGRRVKSVAEDEPDLGPAHQGYLSFETIREPCIVRVGEGQELAPGVAISPIPRDV